MSSTTTAATETIEERAASLPLEEEVALRAFGEEPLPMPAELSAL